MGDIKDIKFEEILKKDFGEDLAQQIIASLQADINSHKEPYVIKKNFIKLLALSDGEDTNIEKKKIEAAVKLNAYWVWIVFGIPAPDLNQS